MGIKKEKENKVEQATYKQLQDLVHSLSTQLTSTEDTINQHIEKVEYWENIATQQNDCILMQAKRYEELEIKYNELASQQPKDTAAENTELKAVNGELKKRNTELDKMLESYEDSYQDQKSKLQSAESKLKNAKESIEKMGFTIQKEEAMTSLLMSELQKYKGERIAIKSRANAQKLDKKRKSVFKDLDIDTEVMEIPSDSFVSSITKSVKIKLDRMGNYSVNQ